MSKKSKLLRKLENEDGVFWEDDELRQYCWCGCGEYAVLAIKENKIRSM